MYTFEEIKYLIENLQEVIDNIDDPTELKTTLVNIEDFMTPNTENKIYTLEEVKQIIRENPYTCDLTTKDPDKIYLHYEDLQEILDSTDHTRRFKIRSWLNTEDYPCDAMEYDITEIYRVEQLRINN